MIVGLDRFFEWGASFFFDSPWMLDICKIPGVDAGSRASASWRPNQYIDVLALKRDEVGT
jgi:hypothetical protein